MSSNAGWMRAIQRPSNTSISSRRRLLPLLCGRSLIYGSAARPLNIALTLLHSFIAFISGAFAAVLVLVSVIDPVFLHFEITPDRSVLFYLGLFTSILAISRGMVPATNQIFDPELLLTEVVGYVHYMPESWEGRLHSHQVGCSGIQAPQFALTLCCRSTLNSARCSR